ncbi:hypothetical protein Sjap_002802 [Stephania japonica]|uniref:S-locus receptor kinase C-terminal domain-containing protein n=1 Tax=Stephania japonica TaxID=461633 RepID=A0AAP0KMI8_9MAGN
MDIVIELAELINWQAVRSEKLVTEKNITWNLWEEGKGLDLMDAAMQDSYSAAEVLKCIHIGLLCVQERAEDSSTMDYVVLMLNSEVPKLLQPKQPEFCLGKTPIEMNSSSSKQHAHNVKCNQGSNGCLKASKSHPVYYLYTGRGRGGGASCQASNPPPPPRNNE